VPRRRRGQRRSSAEHGCAGEGEGIARTACAEGQRHGAQGARQDQIDKLEKAYPAAAEIKDKFKDKWNDIVSGVNVDELKKQVTECAADVASCAKDKLPQLQTQLEEALKGVNLDSVKKQAEEYWNKIQLDLPDMDELKSALADYGGQAKAAWDKFMETNDFSSLTDAAKSIASDAWSQITGWFR